MMSLISLECRRNRDLNYAGCQSSPPKAPTPMVPGMAPKPAVPMPPQPKKPGHMLVLGTGFVGRYVSERLLAQGWLVPRRSQPPPRFS